MLHNHSFSEIRGVRFVISQELPYPHIRAAIASLSKATCKATPYQRQSVKTSATGLTTRANLFFTPQERTTRPNDKCADSYPPTLSQLSVGSRLYPTE